MRNTTDTLPDRKVLAHLFGKVDREWYGVLVKVNSTNRNSVKKRLTKILRQYGHNSAESDGEWIFAKGTYSQDAVKDLEEYLVNCSDIIGNPMMPSGPYFHFLGYEWVEKYKKEY